MKNRFFIIVILCSFMEIASAGENIQVISLEEAINLGLKNNKGFLLSQETMNLSAQHTYLNAKGEYSRPTIDSELSLFEEKEFKVNAQQNFLLSKTGAVISLENNYNLPEEEKTTDISLVISQPLSPKEILTNRRILKDIEDDYHLALVRLKMDKEDFINKIIENFVNLTQQEMTIERTQKNIKTRDDLLLIANLKYEAGEISKMDSMDIELQSKLDKINLLILEDTYQRSKKGFLKILGLNQETDFTIKRTIEPFLDKIPSLDKSYNYVRGYQLFEPELSLKRQQQILKETQLSKNFTCFLEIRHSVQWLLNSFRKEKDDSQIGIKMGWKIYDNKVHKRTLAKLEKDVETEEYNLQERNKEIEDQLRDIYKEIEIIKQKKQLLSGMEKISEAILDAGKLKFKTGMISQSELYNIMERYNKAQEEIEDIKIEEFQIGIKLLSMVGKLESFFMKGGKDEL